MQDGIAALCTPCNPMRIVPRGPSQIKTGLPKMRMLLLSLSVNLAVALPLAATAQVPLWNGTTAGMTEQELSSKVPCSHTSWTNGEETMFGSAPVTLYGSPFFSAFKFRDHHLYQVLLQSKSYGLIDKMENSDIVFSEITDELTRKYGNPVKVTDSTMGLRLQEHDFLNAGLSVRAIYMGEPASTTSITYESSSGGSENSL